MLTGLEEAFGRHVLVYSSGLEEKEAQERLKAIAAWIGVPSGRGRVAGALPEFGIESQVNTFEVDGTLGKRRIRFLKLLGSGLAGTVYLVEDMETGALLAEKHYGPLPARGAKSLGRKLAAAMFAVSRQAPLSFRELPEAAVAVHLANRFIVACSLEHFGHAITPPILYTRYDPQTGGYVHASPFIKGRPLQPWNFHLPLLGEAALFREAMIHWRDFIGKDLGFWGIMRQVDPANFNAYSNPWITPDRHIFLLDTVPGFPGIELRYLWLGARRGEFPPFADAMDLDQLSRFIQKHPLSPREQWARDLTLLRVAVTQWKASEPRVISSPFRWWHVIFDPEIRRANREALLVHLEVKGAILAETAQEYRESLAQTGRFPKLWRHTILKMAPLATHRFLTDGGAYAYDLFLNSWRFPWKVVRGVASFAWRALRLFGRSLLLLGKLLSDSQARLKYAEDLIERWIHEGQVLGRLTDEQAGRLHEDLRTNRDAADLSGLFVVHLSLKLIFPPGTGTTSLALLIPAVMTGQWWLAVPAMAPALLRLGTALWILGLRYPGALLMSTLPEIGTAAAPLALLKHHPGLGSFMIRSLAQQTALKIPGFGERGSFTEMASVAAAQVLVIDPAPLLTPVTVLAMIGIGMGWPWLAWGAGAVYLGAVIRSFILRRRRFSCSIQPSLEIRCPGEISRDGSSSDFSDAPRRLWFGRGNACAGSHGASRALFPRFCW